MTSFVHLHNHTAYSLLDGASKVDDLVAAVAADGQPAVATTDHGNMSAVVPFYKACEKAGVKPIIGIEAYQDAESRFARPQSKKKQADEVAESEAGDKLFYHLTLLAESNVGYKNLIQISSRAYLEGWYRKPRTDWEVLQEHSEGVIATSGCLGGLTLQHLLRGDLRGAREVAGRYQDIFGRDNFFIEVQDHGIPDQRRTMSDLLALAKDLDAPLLAANDSHYAHQHDSVSHDALLCLQTGALRSDPNRFKFESDQHYIKSAREMRELFAEVPEACDNTLRVAERADVKLEFGNLFLPKFPVPPGFVDDSEFLSELTLQGATERYGDPLPDAVVARLAYELKTIADLGFSSYFLILWDLVRFARSQGIRTGEGRGSAAGCCVSFCLGITGVDPIKHGLHFERFLNPHRVSPPDVDLDIVSFGREPLINYVAERYGADRVAQIVTFASILSRAAVRDAARVLGHPPQLGDRISKAMPPALQGRVPPLSASFEFDSEWPQAFPASSELRQMVASDPDVAEVVQVARGLEGLKKAPSVHAAAVVISDGPITDYVPVQQQGEGAPIVTQYEMKAVEDLGLLKMDFLGLRNLDIIDECLRLVGHDVPFGEPFDDPKVFELLRSGHTLGLFQVEGRAMSELLVRMQPSSFEDIAATLALYRPGPMDANMHNDYADRKNGRQFPSVFHEDAREILGETQGLMVYQEQVLEIAKRFAGFSMAEADLLRRAIGKKNADEMKALKERFVSGCSVNGYEQAFSEGLFNMIDAFSGYSFNKAHAYGYGVTTYQTAYLKAHHPAEYMAALCTHAKLEKKPKYLAEARRMGLHILNPDVNLSDTEFTAEPGVIRVGLGSIRDMGSMGAKIVQQREADGPFADLLDFTKRCEPLGLTRKSLQALVHAGALDSFGHKRMGLEAVLDEIMSATKKEVRAEAAGQLSMFADQDWSGLEVPDVEFDAAYRMHLERKAVGLYISGHPLEGTSVEADVEIGDADEWVEGKFVEVVGVVTDLDVRTTKAGGRMASFAVEDLTGSISVVAFPRTWEKISFGVADETIARVKVRVSSDSRSGERSFVVVAFDEVAKPSLEATLNPFRLLLPRGFQSHPEFMARLKGLLLRHRGRKPVFLHRSRSAATPLEDPYLVDGSDRMLRDVRELFAEFAVNQGGHREAER